MESVVYNAMTYRSAHPKQAQNDPQGSIKPDGSLRTPDF